MTNAVKPTGKLALQTVAMPADTNANGDVFGGWMVSHMDLAAAIEGWHIAKSRIVTIAIDALTFILPVYVGDTVTCYVELVSKGNTSMKLQVEAWALSIADESARKVAKGTFTFVAINDERKPHPVDPTKR